MSTGGEPGHLHRTPDGTAIVTRRSEYSYFFYDKHHGCGSSDASQWIGGLTDPEEFAIFDRADNFELSDEQGNLYGLRLGPEGEILVLGTWDQQIAEFPRSRSSQPWHGYPLWPSRSGPVNRQKQEIRPPKHVFVQMEHVGLLTERQRKRLQKGEHLR